MGTLDVQPARRLPARLRAVRALVTGPGPVADVGSGHGLLAVALASEGREVIATERTPATVAELRRCLALAAAAVPVEIRRGEGLGPIAPGEVETAVIAGLGGRSMVRLLERAAWLPPKLVLQPQSDVDAVAGWIARCGRASTRTDVIDRGRRYVAFAVEA